MHWTYMFHPDGHCSTEIDFFHIYNHWFKSECFDCTQHFFKCFSSIIATATKLDLKKIQRVCFRKGKLCSPPDLIGTGQNSMNVLPMNNCLDVLLSPTNLNRTFVNFAVFWSVRGMDKRNLEDWQIEASCLKSRVECRLAN